ncbi:MAG: patatin-like phospholipase family protein [Alphaproteobacteria bacterium]
MATRRSSRPTRTINLALQGGGSHGAFTWGVLDRLLEEDWLAIDGISATSAGAMNAAVLADGFLAGGAEGARRGLTDFWSRVAEATAASPLQPTAADKALGGWNMDLSPAYLALDMLSRVLSPYQLNPLGLNPLRDILGEHLNFDRLRRARNPQLFVCTTNVKRGDIRVFRNHELTVDALLASACLPFLYQAIEIDGDPYWDGGYMGNPALYPLIQNCASEDIVIVQINPIRHDQVPMDARHIIDRVNEISFNATLIRELRAMDLVNSIVEKGASGGTRRLKHIKVHMIEDEALMGELGFSSKLNASWDFLTFLRDRGRDATGAWLAEHADELGRRSTFDVSALSQSGRAP